MVDYTYYIKAKSVADTYLDHISMLNNTPKKQHFLARLSLCQGYHHLLENKQKKDGLFKFIVKDLQRKLDMDFNEMWDELMMNDNYGYKKEIKKKVTDDIKFYFGMTSVLDDVCILLRNGIELPKDVDKKINKESLLRMINIADNDQIMKVDEATVYVNGIGNIIILKNQKDDLVPIGWDVINECYHRIVEYYIGICSKDNWLNSKHKLHNNIYGLTHCVINLTNFYTKPLEGNLIDVLSEIKRILIQLVDNQRRTNYKIFNDDTLAEMLLCIKLLGAEGCSERLSALSALSLRFDSAKLMFREHKAEKLKDELLKNEHTNILYILNVLL